MAAGAVREWKMLQTINYMSEVFFVVPGELLKDIQLMIFLLKHISNLHEKQHNHNKWRQIFSRND